MGKKVILLDFYLLGVQKRLLTRCKILDVVHSRTICKIFFFLLSHPASAIKVIWISPVNRFVDYKFIV